MIPLGHSTAEEDCENPLNLLVSKVWIILVVTSQVELSMSFPRFLLLLMTKTFTFILFKAREFLDSDPSSAKAWLITAKTLFPKEFSVQFEAYAIEKAAGNVKQAGLLLKDLVFR